VASCQLTSVGTQARSYCASRMHKVLNWYTGNKIHSLHARECKVGAGGGVGNHHKLLNHMIKDNIQSRTENKWQQTVEED